MSGAGADRESMGSQLVFSAMATLAAVVFEQLMVNPVIILFFCQRPP